MAARKTGGLDIREPDVFPLMHLIKNYYAVLPEGVCAPGRVHGES